MAAYRLEIARPRPFFAELPYYLWGQVAYDSEGDCESPTDCEWSWIELANRETGELLVALSSEGVWTIEGPDPAAARLAHFMTGRCRGRAFGQKPADSVGDWDHERAQQLADRVKLDFERPELRPFAVGHSFWGSWKWIGWFASEFTWVGRWIMDAVVRNDERAVYLCADWLRAGTGSEPQSAALRYALARLTQLSFATDQEWTAWYFGAAGRNSFPKPDFDQWLADLKRIHGET